MQWLQDVIALVGKQPLLFVSGGLAVLLVVIIIFLLLWLLLRSLRRRPGPNNPITEVPETVDSAVIFD